METKHTPGPWRVNRLYSNGCEVCPRILADGDWIADVVGAPHLGHETTLPNARLIAAAPDLLEALCHLCNWCEVLDYDGHVSIRDSVEKAREVIARATGEAPCDAPN